MQSFTLFTTYAIIATLITVQHIVGREFTMEQGGMIALIYSNSLCEGLCERANWSRESRSKHNTLNNIA